MAQSERAKFLQKQLERQLADAAVTSERLNRELEKKDYPAEPSPGFTRFAIEIQFDRRGRWYEYLILRVGNTYYTTAVGMAGRHESWRAFIDWLRANAFSHTELEVLTTHTTGVADHVVTIFDQDECTK